MVKFLSCNGLILIFFRELDVAEKKNKELQEQVETGNYFSVSVKTLLLYNHLTIKIIYTAVMMVFVMGQF